ncbi:hypothetical protein [Thomasclavelia cocleata]|nr:hypothetical protein [Thomasclavelia cocleata]
MKKLCELVTIEENNENCVVLKVKPNKRLELIKLGCFNGNEVIFVLTKGDDETIRIIEDSKKSYSWDRHTLVVDNMNVKRQLITECIIRDMDIYCGKNKKLILKSMRDLSEPIVEHTIKFILSRKVDVHKDDEYYGFFDTINDAKLHFEKLGFHLSFKEMKVTQTGVVVCYFKISKPNKKIIRKQLLKHTIIKNSSIYSNIIELEVNIIDKVNKTSVVDITTHCK